MTHRVSAHYGSSVAWEIAATSFNFMRQDSCSIAF